jgi:hypothetical protein
VFLAMTYGGQPWNQASRSEPFYAKFAGAWDRFAAKHPPGLVADDAFPSCGPLFAGLPKKALRLLVLKMMHPDPEQRMRIQDVVKDRWVKTIECCIHEGEEDHATAKPVAIDASKRSSCVLDRVAIKKHHNHLPPKETRMPQHSFDMGDGYD